MREGAEKAKNSNYYVVPGEGEMSKKKRGVGLAVSHSFPSHPRWREYVRTSNTPFFFFRAGRPVVREVSWVNSVQYMLVVAAMRK